MAMLLFDFTALLDRSMSRYWTKRRHAHLGVGLKHAVETALLFFQRSNARAGAVAESAPALPHLPVETWTAICGFLRSMDMHT